VRQDKMSSIPPYWTEFSDSRHSTEDACDLYLSLWREGGSRQWMGRRWATKGTGGTKVGLHSPRWHLEKPLDKQPDFCDR